MDEKNYKVLGEKIRTIRQIKGISQEAIADKLNISQAAYSKIESGKLILSYERLQIILEELNLNAKTIRDFKLDDLFQKESFRN